MHIPTYTYRYIHKHANTCKYIHINLKLPYLSYQWAIWDEPNNRFNNKKYPSNGANLYIYKNASLNLSVRRKSGHHGQVRHITMLKTILQFQPLISTFVEYSVMNILLHVWGRLATHGRFYSRWKTLKNENRAPVNQLLWTWKIGSCAPMLWVNTWCSPILHSLFHCHRPAHAHLDTCKINDL